MLSCRVSVFLALWSWTVLFIVFLCIAVMVSVVCYSIHYSFGLISSYFSKIFMYYKCGTCCQCISCIFLNSGCRHSCFCGNANHVLSNGYIRIATGRERPERWNFVGWTRKSRTMVNGKMESHVYYTIRFMRLSVLMLSVH